MEESLSHTKWECKYHIIFIPKCRRKAKIGVKGKSVSKAFIDSIKVGGGLFVGLVSVLR